MNSQNQTRREFLSMALGATVVASIVPAKIPPIKSLPKENLLELIYTGMLEMARDYVNGDTEERQIIIETLNKVIADMRSDIARRTMTEFRDGLLCYSATT